MGTYWEPEILSKVVRLLKAGELYLFAGAGLSCVAGYPSWRELLERFAEAYRALPRGRTEIKNELGALVERRDVVLVSHLRALGHDGEDATVRVLMKAFGEEKTSETHKMLMQLPFAGYITTNYDRCLEIAGARVEEAKALVDRRWFCFPKHRCAGERALDGVYDGDKFLLHMHGCLYVNGRIDSEGIILRKDQYVKFYKGPELVKIYEELFYRPLLVLGTSFSDPYFLNRLYEARGHHSADLRGERKTCYLVVPKKERPATEASDKSVYGVEFNYFDENDALALEKMVGELKNRCEETPREPKGREGGSEE